MHTSNDNYMYIRINTCMHLYMHTYMLMYNII